MVCFRFKKKLRSRLGRLAACITGGMPFNNPIPDYSKRKAPNSLVQAEKLMQIAFVLPCAMVIGWFVGWSVDHFLHTHGVTFAGLILGLVAGMVTVIRMAMNAMNSLYPRKPK